MADVLTDLVALSHDVAEPSEDLVIYAEGNTSARADDESFWVKASGQSLSCIQPKGFVRVLNRPLISLVESRTDSPPDAEIREKLNAARIDPNAGSIPSTEAFLHAMLYTMPGTNFVVHTHPTAVLSVCLTSHAQDFATRRLFPDQIVLCGAASAYVPYVAPGLLLAKELRSAVHRVREAVGTWPTTAILANHGLISWGKSPGEALAGTKMMVKAARAFLGAHAVGLSARFLSDAEVAHIAGWPDEAYRHRILFDRPTD